MDQMPFPNNFFLKQLLEYLLFYFEVEVANNKFDEQKLLLPIVINVVLAIAEFKVHSSDIKVASIETKANDQAKLLGKLIKVMDWEQEPKMVNW